ncbi:MAG: prepilin-type N-terminal cleavage/methylation domain-containing protein [Patescibacteria group bacterium]
MLLKKQIYNLNKKIFVKKVFLIEKQKGFTLMEILISIGIIAILSSAMLQVTSVSNTKKQLITEAGKVQSLVRMAQSYSLSIPKEVSERHVCGFGFYPVNDRDFKVFYVYNDDFENQPKLCENENIYTDNPSNPDAESVDIRKEELSEGFTFSDHGSREVIFFRSPYGDVFKNKSELDGGTEHSFEIEHLDWDNVEIKVNGGGKIIMN